MSVTITDNTKQVLAAIAKAKERALEKVGLTAEGYAKKLAPVDTGALRNSISHTVYDDAAYIGTDQEYAAYVELGTGQYADGGRQDSWVYKDAKGHWHRTSGQKAQPYLKPAAARHTEEYRDIIAKEMGDSLKAELEE